MIATPGHASRAMAMARTYIDLRGSREVAGDHRVHGQRSPGGDAIQHRSHRFGRDRTAAGRAPAWVTAKQRCGDQDRLDAQPRQRQRAEAAAHPAGRDEAGEDEDGGHRGGPRLPSSVPVVIRLEGALRGDADVFGLLGRKGG